MKIKFKNLFKICEKGYRMLVVLNFYNGYTIEKGNYNREFSITICNFQLSILHNEARNKMDKKISRTINYTFTCDDCKKTLGTKQLAQGGDNVRWLCNDCYNKSR